MSQDRHPSSKQIPRVTVQHATVPGRARLQVTGLRHAAGLERRLNRHLPGHGGIRAVSASARTGNLLVLYDPDRSIDTIVELVERVLEHPRALEAMRADEPTIEELAAPETSPRVTRWAGWRLRDVMKDAAGIPASVIRVVHLPQGIALSPTQLPELPG